MVISPGSTALLSADAFVRGEARKRVGLAQYRGTWTVVALGIRHADVLELAALEEAFAADGAVVLAATPDEWHDVATRYGDERTVRFPILTGVPERRRITAVVDPDGVVRHLGLRRTARETLAALEDALLPVALAV